MRVRFFEVFEVSCCLPLSFQFSQAIIRLIAKCFNDPNQIPIEKCLFCDNDHTKVRSKKGINLCIVEINVIIHEQND